ncbi:MAG: TetR family transcriptional regulator, partial [Umezawaea sp.]
KDELLRVAVDRALDGLFAVVAEIEEVPGRAIDRLEHVLRGSVAVLVEQLPFVTLLLRVRGNTKVERAALARRREFDHLITDLVKQAESEGDVREGLDPATVARLLFGMVNSLTEWYRPRKGSDHAELADTVCHIAFDGIRKR